MLNSEEISAARRRTDAENKAQAIAQMAAKKKRDIFNMSDEGSKDTGTESKFQTAALTADETKGDIFKEFGTKTKEPQQGPTPAGVSVGAPDKTNGNLREVFVGDKLIGRAQRVPKGVRFWNKWVFVSDGSDEMQGFRTLEAIKKHVASHY